MKTTRKLITIDEAACNGCGNCVTACAEGALQLVNGKARLVKEQFCDGFGDCIGDCPTGALKIEEVESAPFDVDATRAHVLATAGPQGVRRMEAAGQTHAGKASPPTGGCPGSRMRFQPRPDTAAVAPAPSGQAIRSELQQWPVQLHLLQAGAPFFKNRELVVLSTCAPIASADVHWRFIRGRAVAVGCPKLDDTAGYADKLGAILAEPSIPAVTVVRMEVPCCGGLTAIVREAIRLSGRTDLKATEVTVGVQGDIIGTHNMAA